MDLNMFCIPHLPCMANCSKLTVFNESKSCVTHHHDVKVCKITFMTREVLESLIYMLFDLVIYMLFDLEIICI